jgi:hypothetical protein
MQRCGLLQHQEKDDVRGECAANQRRFSGDVDEAPKWFGNFHFFYETVNLQKTKQPFDQTNYSKRIDHKKNYKVLNITVKFLQS